MTHEVVGALIIKSQKILLGQHSPTREFCPGVWDVFGGHIEPAEHQDQTLVRELWEELGITPTQWTHIETLGISVPQRNETAPHQLCLHLYLVTAWSGTPTNRQLHEHTTIQWFSRAQAARLDIASPA